MTRPGSTMIFPAPIGGSHNLTVNLNSPTKISEIRIGNYRFVGEDVKVLSDFVSAIKPNGAPEDSKESVTFLGFLLMGLANSNSALLDQLLKKTPKLARALDSGIRIEGSTLAPLRETKIVRNKKLARVLGEMCMDMDNVESMRWIFGCGGDAAGVLEDTVIAKRKKNTNANRRTLEFAMDKGSVQLWRLLHEVHGSSIFWNEGITDFKERPRAFDLVERKRADLLGLWLNLDPTLLDAHWKPGYTLLQHAKNMPEADSVVDVILSSMAKRSCEEVMGTLKEDFQAQVVGVGHCYMPTRI